MGRLDESGLPFPSGISDEMKAAFESAWAHIAASGSPFADPDLAPWARETLAHHILALAKSGTLDLDKLRMGELVYRDGSPAEPVDLSQITMLSQSKP